MKKPNPSLTAEQLAQLMLSELHSQRGVLYQQDAVCLIEANAGEQFLYENDNGNTAIDKLLLAAFRKITGDTIVWVRGERCWRQRDSGDELSRQQ